MDSKDPIKLSKLPDISRIFARHNMPCAYYRSDKGDPTVYPELLMGDWNELELNLKLFIKDLQSEHIIPKEPSVWDIRAEAEEADYRDRL